MDRLVLRRSDYNFYYSYKFYVCAVIFVLTIAAFLGWMYQIKPKAFYEFLQTETTLYLSIYGIGCLIYRAWLKKTYIEISEEGIEYVSGLPNLLGKYYPSWKKSWGEIQAVSISEHVNFVNPELRYFFVRTNNADYKIFPTRWRDPNTKGDSVSVIFKGKLFKKKRFIESKIKESPFYIVFEKKGLLRSGTETLKPKSEWTDINTSPIALTMVVIFALSVMYFITENYFTLSEFYVEKPPYLWFVVIGVFASLVAFLAMKDSKLKPAEIVITSIFVGFGIAMVCYPMVLRINQWSDNDGLKIYTYTLIERGRWMPEGSNEPMPDLTFDLAYSDYWNKFEINTSKEFELRKGGLGFYQVNMAPIYADQREYYESK